MRVLAARNVSDPEEAERYFRPKVRYLSSPFLMNGINTAIARILKAFDDYENILVYGDRDVDGVTSTVLLTETLRTYYDRVDYTVPVIEDGYGLNNDYIDAAEKDGITLIITVDCGISNAEEVAYAASKGIDVIVTDHHEPPEILPEAVTLLDPKLPASGCPQTDLAGVGVAFKLALAVETAMSLEMSKDLLALDLTGNELSAVKFSPAEGFKRVKRLSEELFSESNRLLFFSKREISSISSIMPDLESALQQRQHSDVVILERLFEEKLPDFKSLSKQKVVSEFGLGKIADPGELLVFVYLKALESALPALRERINNSMDLLAIGTIADMVPLTGENRVFAKLGLNCVSKTSRAGLISIFNELGWHRKKIVGKDVGFGIAPMINASGRLSTAKIAMDLLLSDSAKESEALAKELFDLNTKRKGLGEICYREVREYLLEQNDLDKNNILMVAAPIANQGVTGIVATRLMIEFGKPVVVLLHDKDSYTGSARSCKNINILDVLSSSAQHIEKFGGHVGAAGLTVAFDQEEALRKSLGEYAEENISEEDLASEWLIDAKLDISEVNEAFLSKLTAFSPFGMGNQPPVFVCYDAPFSEVRKVGDTKAHLRFKFKRSRQKTLFGIAFNLGKLMESDRKTNGTCSIVYQVEPNDYNGVRSAQVVILDCKFKEKI